MWVHTHIYPCRSLPFQSDLIVQHFDFFKNLFFASSYKFGWINSKFGTLTLENWSWFFSILFICKWLQSSSVNASFQRNSFNCWVNEKLKMHFLVFVVNICIKSLKVCYSIKWYYLSYNRNRITSCLSSCNRLAFRSISYCEACNSFKNSIQKVQRWR